MTDLKTQFMLMADQQGWTESTQRDVLLDFIENYGNEYSFVAFLDKQAAQEDDMSNDRLIGFKEAEEELNEDNDLLAYECEIGLSSSEDIKTPFETYMVIVASNSVESATEQARNFCEENTATTRDTWFEACSPASEIDINTYL